MTEDVTLLLLLEARDMASGAVRLLKREIGGLTGAQKLHAAAFVGTGLAAAAVADQIFKFTKSGVKQAADYQSQLTKVDVQALKTVETQKGANAELKTMSDLMLTQGPKWGVGPLVLARGLLNVESIGARAHKRLLGLHVSSTDLMTNIAKLQMVSTGGKPGDIDSQTVAQALIAMLVNPIAIEHVKGKRDRQFTSAGSVAGMLNKVVGIGDMRFPDLLAALNTGIVPSAAAQHVDARSLFAAMATMTDSAMPASRSAVYIRQVIAMIAGARNKPKTEGMLESIGMTGKQLQEDARGPGGLLTVFEDLNKHLQSAGLRGLAIGKSIASRYDLAGATKGQVVESLKFLEGKLPEMNKMGKRILAEMLGTSSRSTSMRTGLQNLIDQVLSGKDDPTYGSSVFNQIFGGARTGGGAAVLLTEIGRFKGRYGQLGGMDKQSIDPAFKETLGTLNGQLSQFHASIQSIKISLGTGFLPILGNILQGVNQLLQPLAVWTAHHKKLAAIIATSLFAFFALFAVISMIAAAAIILDGALLPILLTAGIIAGVVVLAALAFAGLVYVLHRFLKIPWGKAIRDAFAVLDGNWLFGLVSIFADAFGGKIPRLMRQWGSDLIGFLGVVWNRVVEEAQRVWRDFAGWLGTLWGDIRNNAIDAWNSIGNFFGDTWTKIKNGVIEAWNDITAWFGGLPGRILDALGDAGHWLWDLGGRVLDGLWNGIKDAFNSPPAWLSTIALLLFGAVTGGAGPAALWLYDKGTAAAEGLWNGIKYLIQNGPEWLPSIATFVFSAITGATGPAILWLVDKGINAGSGLWNGIRTGLQAAQDWLGSVPGWVSGKFTGLGGWLLDEGHAVAGGLWDGVQGGLQFAPSWLRSIGGKAASIIGDVSGLFSGAGRWLVGVGRAIGAGLWNGIKDILTHPGKALLAALEAAVKSVIDKVPGLGWVLGKVGGLVSGGGKADGSGAGKGVGVKAANDTLAGSSAPEIIQSLSDAGASLQEVVQALRSAGAGDDANHLAAFGRVPLLGDGGIATRAMLAVIGDSGPEAVIPLSQLTRGSGSAGGGNIYIDLSGSSFIDDAGINRMLDKLGGHLVGRVLPGAGIAVRSR